MDLQRQIDIKNAYLQMIIDLGFDYDGYDDAEHLKSLIDELCSYAKYAIENNDKEPIYESYSPSGETYQDNILMERLDI